MQTIVGVSMVLNEECFIGNALSQIREFCDRIIVIDNGSTDDTVAIAEHYGAEVIVIKDLTETHDPVLQFVGTPTWVFGVDGDELYDRAGLRVLKRRMGEFEGSFQVKGLFLHAVSIHGQQVSGYINDQNPTKLYNFLNISAWPKDGERCLFHPKTRDTHGGIDRSQEKDWNSSLLRCVHMRAFRRSRHDLPQEVGRRLNNQDRAGFGSSYDRGASGNERLCYYQGTLSTHFCDWAPREDLP